MSTFVIVVLVVLGAVALIGGVIAFLASRKAPQGLEDERGFRATDAADETEPR